MNKVIKGVLIGMHLRSSFLSHKLFAAILFALMSIFNLMLFIFRDMPAHLHQAESLKASLYFEVLFICMAVSFYYLSKEDYYYYEFNTKTLTVKNILNRYSRQLDYYQIIKVRFYREIYGSKVVINFYEEGFVRTKEYTSCNFSNEDWQEFRYTLEKLVIQYEDPSGQFFS